MFAHMFRTFFTGAFRKPRETNWVVGVLLIFVATFEGFSGYSLPDDLLSGVGLRIASGITLTVPIIGTWAHWALFGGEFPGTEIIPRLYIVHVLILPGVLLALIGLHVGLVWYQKHTQFPGPGRTEKNVVGVRILPVFAAKGGAFFAVCAGIMAMMGGIFQINPIWNLGPYNPAQISSGSQPDFYMWFSEGMARIFPAWEIVLGNYRIPAAFWPTAVFLPLPFVVAAIYPAIERKMTGDNALHNLLQRPRDVPVRTALGVMAIAFYVVAVPERDQRLDRVLLRRLAERHHVGGPDRAAHRAADRLLGGLPVVPGPAAVGPRGARARHRDRHRPAPAARRVHRDPPAAGRRGPPRTRHPAGVPGRPGAQADEPAGFRRRSGGRFADQAGPGVGDRGAGAGPSRAGGGRGARTPTATAPPKSGSVGRWPVGRATWRTESARATRAPPDPGGALVVRTGDAWCPGHTLSHVLLR